MWVSDYGGTDSELFGLYADLINRTLHFASEVRSRFYILMNTGSGNTHRFSKLFRFVLEHSAIGINVFRIIAKYCEPSAFRHSESE